MLRFHALIHGDEKSQPAALQTTFDAAYEALSRLPRLFIEPDGSFVWTGVADDGSAWQIDGNLIDQVERLAHVELKGHCPEEQFDALLRALGWPEQSLLFQLPTEGLLLDEQAFRRRSGTP
jgi:hypothetical protein